MKGFGRGWIYVADFILQEKEIFYELCNSAPVPIFKNKGVFTYNNYRGIKSQCMKVWAKRKANESEITQNQFGFMSDCGATYAIFTLRQLCAKYRRDHRNVHMVLVDLEKA